MSARLPGRMRQGCSSPGDGVWHREDPGDPGVGVQRIRKSALDIFGHFVFFDAGFESAVIFEYFRVPISIQQFAPPNSYASPTNSCRIILNNRIQCYRTDKIRAADGSNTCICN